MQNRNLTSCLKNRIQHLKQKRQISRFDITVFLRQFATLITAGIPITQCCEILEKSQEKTTLRLLIYSIKREILAGKSLFYSMQCHPIFFDDFTCQLIRIGEETGKLDSTLLHIAKHQEKNLELRKQIKQALFYPCTITMTSILITFGMFLFVIPRFNELFQDMHSKLPQLTIWIFYLSSQLKQYCTIVLIVICLLISVSFYHKDKRYGRYFYHFALKIPFLKNCLRKIILANFARNLALTFAAGMPITEALKLAGSASDHIEFANIVAKLHGKISAGLQLHHGMAAFPYFPALMVQMIKIGEESGMLEHMLTKIADFLESDIDNLINHFSKLLEPLIMVVLGVLIGGLIIGMYLPIFKLGSAF